MAERQETYVQGSVLVVDDEVLIRFVISEELRSAGYSVVEASTADEALTLIAAGLPADLLISDVRMPGVLDGVALVRAARVLRPELAIALSSAHYSPGERELQGVVNEFLPKPYLPQRLLELVDRLLGTER